MPRPIFSQFILENSKAPALKRLKALQRGKKLGDMYRRLSAAQKAALAKRAASAASFKRSKVALSVRMQGRRLGIPAAIIKKNWFTTGGSTVAARLRKIAKDAGIKARRPRIKPLPSSNALRSKSLKDKAPPKPKVAERKATGKKSSPPKKAAVKKSKK